MRSAHKSESGAASVLVVFMMILLVTFGSMALSAALSNQRLGALSTAWITDYYWMDTQAELELFEIDQILAQAERTAQEQLILSDYLNFAASYQNEAQQALQLAAEEHGWELSGTAAEIIVEYTIKGRQKTAATAPDKYLSVKIGVKVPDYSLMNSGIWIRDENTLRFYIHRWQEWQESVKIDEEIKFWDGNMS